jgi:hypothetical protein
MERYEDISDVAYADGGLETLTTAQRELFERTITAVGVPPTLRHRARLNLLSEFGDGGEEAVRDVLGRAVRRMERAEAWLLGRGGASAVVSE